MGNKQFYLSAAWNEVRDGTRPNPRRIVMRQAPAAPGSAAAMRLRAFTLALECRPATAPPADELLQTLQPRSRSARSGGPARLGAGVRQSRAGDRAVCRAGAVRPHHRHAGEGAGGLGGAEHRRPDAADGRLGRLRAVHHRMQRAGRAACRPARAPPQAGRAHDVFRAPAAASALVPRRHPFGPAAESDAHRRRRALGACGCRSSASTSRPSCRCSCCCRSRSTSTGGSPACSSSCA